MAVRRITRGRAISRITRRQPAAAAQKAPTTPSATVSNHHIRQVILLNEQLAQERAEIQALEAERKRIINTSNVGAFKRSKTAQRLRQLYGSQTRLKELVKSHRMKAQGYSGQDPYGRGGTPKAPRQQDGYWQAKIGGRTYTSSNKQWLQDKLNKRAEGQALSDAIARQGIARHKSERFLQIHGDKIAQAVADGRFRYDFKKGRMSIQKVTHRGEPRRSGVPLRQSNILHDHRVPPVPLGTQATTGQILYVNIIKGLFNLGRRLTKGGLDNIAAAMNSPQTSGIMGWYSAKDMMAPELNAKKREAMQKRAEYYSSTPEAREFQIFVATSPLWQYRILRLLGSGTMGYQAGHSTAEGVSKLSSGNPEDAGKAFGEAVVMAVLAGHAGREFKPKGYPSELDPLLATLSPKERVLLLNRISAAQQAVKANTYPHMEVPLRQIEGMSKAEAQAVAGWLRKWNPEAFGSTAARTQVSVKGRSGDLDTALPKRKIQDAITELHQALVKANPKGGYRRTKSGINKGGEHFVEVKPASRLDSFSFRMRAARTAEDQKVMRIQEQLWRSLVGTYQRGMKLAKKGEIPSWRDPKYNKDLDRFNQITRQLLETRTRQLKRDPLFPGLKEYRAQIAAQAFSKSQGVAAPAPRIRQVFRIFEPGRMGTKGSYRRGPYSKGYTTGKRGYLFPYSSYTKYPIKRRRSYIPYIPQKKVPYPHKPNYPYSGRPQHPRVPYPRTPPYPYTYTYPRRGATPYISHPDYTFTPTYTKHPPYPLPPHTPGTQTSQRKSTPRKTKAASKKAYQLLALLNGKFQKRGLYRSKHEAANAGMRETDTHSHHSFAIREAQVPMEQRLRHAPRYRAERKFRKHRSGNRWTELKRHRNDKPGELTRLLKAA